MKIKVGTLCSGYDSQCMALDRLKNDFPQFDYELMFWSEIDKFAIQAHNAVYPQYSDRNIGDMTLQDWSVLPHVDLLTYSTPCTDISCAGQQKGIAKGSGTRSSILWHTEEAIKHLRPKYLVMENVKALVTKKFLPFFKQWEEIVRSYGYTNFTAVLNSKDYGVPQSRERVFMVSMLGEDVSFNFPTPFPLTRRMRDILESDVDESFYLSDKMLEYFYRVNADLSHGHNFTPKGDDDIAFTVTTREGCVSDSNYVRVKQVGNLVDDSGGGYKNPHRGRVYDVSGLAPTIHTCSGGNLEPKILQRSHGFNQGNLHNIVPTITSNSFSENNFVVGSMQANSYKGTVDGVSPTITSACGMGGGQTPMVGGGEHIRKITPRECYRLMDVSESDIDKIQAAGLSKSQQYKLAGNSIVVAVLYHIFRKMFINTENEKHQLKLF